MKIFQIILIIIVLFVLYNFEAIINNKRKYLIETNKKGNNSKNIKQYSNYLKILDCFIVFFIALFIFNILLNAINKTTQTVLIFEILTIVFTLINMLLVILFKYNIKFENKAKIINIFYYINIVIIIILFIINLISAH